MSYTPDKKTFLEKAAHGNLVPVWRELLADMDSPVSAYDKVREHLRPLERPSHVLRDVGVLDLGRLLGRGRGVGILGELEHRRLGPGRLDNPR